MKIREFIWPQDRTMEKAMTTQKIPETDSIQELAQFWDAHDLMDFEDELEEVIEPLFERERETVVAIRLPADEVEAIKRIARSKGIEPTSLIREWVLAQLHAT